MMRWLLGIALTAGLFLGCLTSPAPAAEREVIVRPAPARRDAQRAEARVVQVRPAPAKFQLAAAKPVSATPVTGTPKVKRKEIRKPVDEPQGGREEKPPEAVLEQQGTASKKDSFFQGLIDKWFAPRREAKHE